MSRRPPISGECCWGVDRWIAPLLGSCLVLVLCASHGQAQNQAGSERWVPLFNGKDLDGWKVKIKGYNLGDNYGDTFRVENGVLKVSYDHYAKFDQKFGHLFYKTPFSHYKLRVEYRFVGDQCPGGRAGRSRTAAS